MVKIDLLITKGNNRIRLSELGLVVNDVIDHSPSIEKDIRRVNGRNGGIFNGAVHVSKFIDAEGYYTVDSIAESETIEHKLYGLLADSRPYFITQMLPKDENLYKYQNPGDTSGDIDLLNIPHTELSYRWLVLLTGAVNSHFRGRSEKGLVYDFRLSFETVELPYGQTIPKDIQVSNNIPYNGTAVNSQLDYPWVLELTATSSQTGTFEVTLGKKTYRHESQTPINAGDVFEISGIATYQNHSNVTHRTNYEYFELDPMNGNRIPFNTTFNGNVIIKDFKEFYI